MNEVTEMIGRSAAMKAVHALVERVAPTDATVLVSGESGSGKEPVAQAIHRQSERRAGPFLAVNCGAIPATLIESELFGHERGSFTGASRSHEGVFERASGGTLFLDEVTEMPSDMQTRLLRLLETQRFYRVGGSTEIRTDVRIVAATNRCPIHAAQDGVLREDLLYRLAVFPIVIPPLRERGDDVVLLANHFLDDSTSATARARASPRRRSSRSCAIVARQRARIEECDRACLHPLGRRARTGAAAGAVEQREPDATLRDGVQVRCGTTLAEAERSLIEVTLSHCNGNKTRAAQTSGLQPEDAV